MNITRYWKRCCRLLSLAVGGIALALATPMASAQDKPDDGLTGIHAAALKGKTVAFVPIAMSFDIPQAFDADMRRHADKWGYNYVLRDPNFSVEQAVQAVDQLIAEKPDVLIVMPYDASAFNRLIKKAQAAGILWVWVTLKSPVNGDVYVGPDFVEIGGRMAKEAARLCGAGTSGKVAIIQTPPNTPSTISQTAGVEAELALHSNLSVVSKQSAVGDANKARTIAATVLKQHPDLCAIIGLWDGQDVGIPPAVAEAGLTGKVAVISTGAGNQANACDKLADGSYTSYVTFDVATQAIDLNNTISFLLQQKPTPGEKTIGIYSAIKALTKDNITANSCWTIDQFKAPLN